MDAKNRIEELKEILNQASIDYYVNDNPKMEDYEYDRLMAELIDLEDKNPENRQLGVATYLIDRLALRVGNEKGEDEADTVGCCTLRVEHIKFEDFSGNNINHPNDFWARLYANTLFETLVGYENLIA